MKFEEHLLDLPNALRPPPTGAMGATGVGGAREIHRVARGLLSKVRPDERAAVSAFTFDVPGITAMIIQAFRASVNMDMIAIEQETRWASRTRPARQSLYNIMTQAEARSYGQDARAHDGRPRAHSHYGVAL